MSISCSIKKKMGKFQLDISFEGGEESIALMGASGCGKSMTLRCIAGIETPDEGKIVINQKTVFDSSKKINLPPQQRKTGYLFQDYALFPNMTVSRNILTVLPKDRRGELTNILERFHLSNQSDHYPKELSGGQKQRCALARMMVTEPEIILLDEPFAALDSYLRWQMEQEVAAIIAQSKKTSIFVSHDRDEVYRLSDRVVVIDHGKNAQILDKQLLYQHPKSYVDALLTGCKNICPLTTKNDRLVASMFGIDLPLTPVLESKIFVKGRKPKQISYLGIRSKKIMAAQLCTSEQKVVLAYDLVSVTEDVFTYVVMIRPKGALGLLRWEMPKEVYLQVKENQKSEQELCIAILWEDLMLLEE